MSTSSTSIAADADPLLNDPACQEADSKAVMESFANGTPLDAEVKRRVRRRSERATEETRRRLGTINVAVDLIRAGRDEA